MAVTRKLFTGAVAAAGVYGCWLRPLFVRWGATDEEVMGTYPGNGLVCEGKRSPTMAVTIDAPPEQVWPWLLQLGSGRGGWYSWDRLDNGGQPSATEVHPEWQKLAVGDQLHFWAFGRVADAYRVAVIEPATFLGLYGCTDLHFHWLDPGRPRPASYMEGLWGFQLKQLPGGRSRLVVSGYQTIRPRWVERLELYWVFPVIVWVMQARMLAVLKRTIEHAEPAHDVAVHEASTPLLAAADGRRSP